MIMTNSNSIQDVLFFPQMKAENITPQVELNANEQAIYDILRNEKTMDLAVLKEKSGLSKSAWDKGMKGLNKHAIARVNKVDDQLIVELTV